MSNSLGQLIMIPVPLAPNALHTLSPAISQYCKSTQYFFVENIREARRFLKLIDKAIDIDALHFSEINKNASQNTTLCQEWLLAGHTVAVLSDAGCPGIADPGATLAAAAQAIGAPVVPLTGPSSILLALMASGLNGQRFAFHGYLPLKEPDRSKKIKALEAQSLAEGQSQIFIETPYRNNAILADLLRHCKASTRLCIAIHITAPDEHIRTQTIAAWKTATPSLPKQPAIFIILA